MMNIIMKIVKIALAFSLLMNTTTLIGYANVSKSFKNVASFIFSGGREQFLKDHPSKFPDSINKVSWEKCKIFIINNKNSGFNFSLDFNKVNWKSPHFPTPGVMTITGDNDLFVRGDKGSSEKSHKFTASLHVSEKRMMPALKDMAKMCPGIKTKY